MPPKTTRLKRTAKPSRPSPRASKAVRPTPSTDDDTGPLSPESKARIFRAVAVLQWRDLTSSDAPPPAWVRSPRDVAQLIQDSRRRSKAKVKR